MRNLIRLTLTLTSATLAWLPEPSSAAPPSPEYELLFEENFDGPEVNEQLWKHRIDKRMDGFNRRENVGIADGNLVIALRQEPLNGKPSFTGGGLIGKVQFGYGYYESLSKPFMAGRGVHSSFWQSGGAVPNNSLFEIDSYEIDSMSTLGCNNLYIHIRPEGYKEVPWPLRAHVPWKFRPDGWFLDAYEYTPEGVKFYDNGQLVAQVEWPELTAAQVVWLTALNGCGKVDADKLPGETRFDYFRYYAKDYPGINLLPNGNFEYNQDRVAADKPVSWQTQGTPGAVNVIKGAAARDQYKIRLGSADAAHEATIRQTLQFIRNGGYQLTAKVRCSGGHGFARIGVLDAGGKPVFAEIPKCDEWTEAKIPQVTVSSHSATIAITTRGSGGQWLEIDDVRFMKPELPGKPVIPTGPFVLIRDPIWSTAEKHPSVFKGDGKFYFFDRNVGFGPEITVAFFMVPDNLANMAPIARIPQDGTAGWSVQLSEQGQLAFRIGSKTNYRDVVTETAYSARTSTHVACVFNKGTASIFINGKLAKSETGIRYTTDDATAPGRLGNVSELFDAVGDVIMPTGPKRKTEPKGQRKYKAFSGTLRDVRVYNRACKPGEIADLSASNS